MNMRTATDIDLLEHILQIKSIHYAVFDREKRLESASPNLAKWLSREIRSGQSVEEVFSELAGMTEALEETLAAGQDFQIDHIERPGEAGEKGYMSLHFVPYRGGILALVQDTSMVGGLEQRVTQQRNELALLSARLERTQTHLMDIATRFMPGRVVESLLANRESPVIRGECREVTALFADLRGFTQWSQTQTPQNVFKDLNHLLAQAVEIVLRWDGTLDKFMGDAVMVIFNAPHDQPDHIQRAAHCAAELSRLSLPNGKLRFGIGIHSGPAIAGNVGAAQAMNYTALGDTVNRAKRLEEMAASGEILVSEVVARSLEPPFHVEFLRSLEWNGAAGASTVYRLVSA